MSSTIESDALVATPATLGALAGALRLPDVSGMDLEAMEAQDLATLAYGLEQQLAAAKGIIAAVCEPLRVAIAEARHLVKGAIVDAGGKALPHETFDVRLEQGYERDKRMNVLRDTLKDLLPDDLYREAILVKQISGTIEPAMVALAESTPGCTVQYDADLRKLDKFARDFGGAVAKAVSAGAPRVAIGAPRLVIEPRKSALKAVQ